MNKNEVLDAFKLYDLNGDGIIDLQGKFVHWYFSWIFYFLLLHSFLRSEYLQGCKKHLMNHHQTSDEDLTKAFFIFDQNGDGSIDEQEFFAAMAYLGITKSFVKIDKEEIHAGFKSYDVDGDGKISLSG